MNKVLVFFLGFLICFKQLILANTKNNTYINTSNIIYDEEKNIVELSDNSKINIENTNILVDRGIIDYNKDKVEVFGNFYLYQELNILSGKDLKGNTKLDNFQANDVSYIYNDDLKIDSNKAKRSNDTIFFYNNFLTPCELEGYFNCPTWSLRIDKTEYNITKDKFVHFDTFLQIADYKIFYLPYFSHYGVKAPRQRGFLTPTIEFTIGGNSGIKTPYYIPIGVNTDVTTTPTFLFNENLEILENYKLNTILERRGAGGRTNIEIDNIKNKGDTNINTSINFNTKNVINKNMILSANAVFTNSISTTRSINDEPLTFEDIYLAIEYYDFFSNRDYLKAQVYTVESFESSDINKIPISPSINYFNQYLLTDNHSVITNLDYRVLNRDKSSISSPSENYILNFNNSFIFNKQTRFANIYNKFSSINSLNDYIFEHNQTLNRQENKFNIIYSSDIHFNIHKLITPRIKLIIPQEIDNSNDNINEDSNSLAFNYVNQYLDNRFFGNDLRDDTSRIVYGLENNFKISKSNLKFNINQSYDFKKKNNFANLVNQKSHFSDYSLELKTDYKSLSLVSDLRVDEKKLTKKEMNYSLNINKPIELSLNYNETNSSAYKDLSNDTQSLGLDISNKIKENIRLSYSSKLDLKNDFSPYSSGITLSLFDECSQLDLSYINNRYNDNFNTTPEEKLSFTFTMDYLGFFGYEQTTDLFFKETGTFDYGIK